MKIALVAAIASVAFVMLAPPALGLTKDQAWKNARACLMQHGARFVGHRPDGGGFATFTRGRGSTFWTYKTTFRQVASVTVYFAGRPGPNAALKASTRRCLVLGI